MNKAVIYYVLNALSETTSDAWNITESYKKRGFCRIFYESTYASICLLQLGREEESFLVPISSNNRLVLNHVHRIDLFDHQSVMKTLKQVTKTSNKIRKQSA